MALLNNTFFKLLFLNTVDTLTFIPQKNVDLTAFSIKLIQLIHLHLYKSCISISKLAFSSKIPLFVYPK